MNSKYEFDVNFLLENISKKMDNIEYNELIALMYAINILVVKFNFNVSWDLRKLLVEKFPNDLTQDKKIDIATICFSLSSIVDKEIEEKR